MLTIPLIRKVVVAAFMPYLTGVETKEYRYKDTIYMTYHMCLKYGHRLKDIAAFYEITNTRVYYGNSVVENMLSYDKTYKLLTETIKLELDGLILEQDNKDDMIIKTNKSQLDGIVLLLTELINNNKPRDMAEDFIYHEVVNAYNKMRVKSELDHLPRGGYSISITDQQARALSLFLHNVHIPQERYPYEFIQINSMTNQIDQEYGHGIKKIGS